jgi:hypothetical protein
MITVALVDDDECHTYCWYCGVSTSSVVAQSECDECTPYIILETS